MTAQGDKELFPWLMGIIDGVPSEPGGFLEDLASAALRADWDNYRLLRPALLELMNKYPKYHQPAAED